MSDLFLILAQAPDGLSCFLLPRVLPDGSRNAMRLQRLKDKLGNRSNASAEVEFDGALAWQVGEPGAACRTIIEMVSATRLDCVLGSAAGMRRGVVAAAYYSAHRQAFGKDLIAQPLMASVLADLTPGVGGGHRRWPSGWPARPTGRPAGTPPRRRCSASRCPRPSTGCASVPRCTRPRRWSAWAATGTSRSPGCRGCTGTPR